MLHRRIRIALLFYGIAAAVILFGLNRRGWVPFAAGRAGPVTDPQRGFHHK